MLGSQKGYTRTHQVIADARAFGGGLDTAHLLARANLVTNKNLIPGDKPEDWDRPGGLRLGTIEVTRYGMREKEMGAIADFIGRVLIDSAFRRKRSAQGGRVRHERLTFSSV